MRTALTIGLIDGSDVWEFLSGPETQIADQRAAFKELRGTRHHTRYSEVQLWESGSGLVLRHRYIPSKVEVEPAPMVVLELSPAEPDEPPVAEEPQAVEPDATGDFAVPGPDSSTPPKPPGNRRRGR